MRFPRYGAVVAKAKNAAGKIQIFVMGGAGVASNEFVAATEAYTA